MRILLLGGTGAIGSHVVEQLALNKGIELYITTRKQRVDSNNVHYIHGNAKDIVFLRSLLRENWDCIIDFMIYHTTEFKDRYELLLNSTEKYVFLSSARVYSESTTPINENSNRLLDTSLDSVYLTTDEYALKKARQENLLLESLKKNWVIIRPYITFSSERLQLGVLEKEDWLYRALKGKPIVVSKRVLNSITTLTFGYDVSVFLTKIVLTKENIGQIYNITTSQTLTWRNILEIYCNEIEKKCGFYPEIIETDEEYDLKSPSKYQIIYDRYYDRIFDNSKLKNVDDEFVFSETKKSLELCLDNFLINRVFFNINWGSEAKRDKISGIYEPLKDIPKLKNKLKYLINRSFAEKI